MLLKPFGTDKFEIYCCPVKVLDPVVAYFDSTTVTLLLIEEVNVFNELVAASNPTNLAVALLVYEFNEAVAASKVPNLVFADEVKLFNDDVAASKPPTLPLKDAVAVSSPTNLAVADEV